MPLRIGETFAGYRILRLLGSGGMGDVYLVQHPRLPRRNALKVLAADVSADPEYRARFVREADLASTLYHPHIVSVHDRGEDEGQLWIAMDYVDGSDAARLLAERFPAGMPPDQVVRIVTATASALDYAHKQGLLHRDVKPANIMLTHVDDGDEQRILLADFGIARGVDDISGLTTTNMAVGTVAYSAPQQLMGDDIDGRADQYALAATAYHLLTGSHIFPHSNPAVVISRHLNAAPPVLADTRPELSTLDRALAVALSKAPADRFPSCSDFARALTEQSEVPKRDWTRTATQPAPAAGKHSGEAAPPRPSAEVKQSPKGWIIAACVLALITLISVTFVVWHPWQERDSRGDAPSASSTRLPPPLTSNTPSEPPPTAASPSPTPAKTQALTIAPVVNGEPANGYEEVPNAASPTHISDVFGCGGSTAAAAANIYACLPSAAGADICWPATIGTLLCVEDPWTRGLFRVTVTEQLDYAAPQPNPLPFAVLLDNGGRCRLYASGPRTRRDDGWFGVYSCSGGNAILVEEDAYTRGEFSEAIDRSQPFWVVHVGPPGPDSVHFPPPETRTVVTAWFAGD